MSLKYNIFVKINTFKHTFRNNLEIINNGIIIVQNTINELVELQINRNQHNDAKRNETI